MASPARLIRQLRNDPLARDAAVVFIGNGVAGVFSLLYYLVAARMLGVVEYGNFNAILAVLALFTLALQPPYIALLRVYSGYARERRHRSAAAMQERVGRLFLPTAAVIVATAAVGAVPLSGFLQISEASLLLTSVVVALSLMGLNYTSFLSAHQRFLQVTLLWVLNPLSVLAAGSLSMAIGGSAVHALAGFTVGPLVLLLTARRYCRRLIEESAAEAEAPGESLTERGLWRNLLFPTVAVFGFALLGNVDMIAVKRLFPPAEVGYYSFAQTLGKITLFAPFALATVLLPKSVIGHGEGGRSRHILHRALSIAATLCGAIVATVSLWPELAISVIAGEGHPESAALAPRLVMAMSFLALTWLVINYAIAISSFRFVPMLMLVTAGEIALFALLPLDLATVPSVVLATTVLAFGLLYLSLPGARR